MWTGDKYEETRNLSRAELKAAIKAHLDAMPEMKAAKAKASLREGRGAGTMSLTITIKGRGLVRMGERVLRHAQDSDDLGAAETHPSTAALRAALRMLEGEV